jgi:galactokinase
MTEPQEVAGHSATVPCRVNLIGEWIDFNGGTVLPMALAASVTVEILSNQTSSDRVSSAQFDSAQTFNVDTPATDHWADYVRGALQYARKQEWISAGQDVRVESAIPVGAGLSSSAAIIVATLKAMRPQSAPVTDTDLAYAAKEIENEFIGVPCGIMDQMAVALGKPGTALALDTRDCSYELLDIPARWAVVVVHSGIQRALSDGRYRRRRDECLEAAGQLGAEYLCDANPENLGRLDPSLAKRAYHVISEGQRSREAISALRAADRSRFGRLMIESHNSLRDDMDVSVAGIDQLVKDAVDLGADGARITGAGFGGCIVALIDPRLLEDWWKELKTLHPAIERIA